MAKSTLPDHIIVGPHRYELIVDRVAFDSVQAKERSVLRGITDYEALTIHIDPGLPASMLAETVLHETLHTVTGQVAATFQLSNDEEEQLVTRMAPLLLGVIRCNPGLVAFLVDS